MMKSKATGYLDEMMARINVLRERAINDPAARQELKNLRVRVAAALKYRAMSLILRTGDHGGSAA